MDYELKVMFKAIAVQMAELIKAGRGDDNVFDGGSIREGNRPGFYGFQWTKQINEKAPFMENMILGKNFGIGNGRATVNEALKQLAEIANVDTEKPLIDVDKLLGIEKPVKISRTGKKLEI